MIYRIYTEKIGRDENVINAVSTSFDGFTLFHATGYWQGKPEATTVIEIETHDKISVRTVADKIRRLNSQQAVLVVEIESKSELRTLKSGTPSER